MTTKTYHDELNSAVKNTIEDAIKSLQTLGCSFPCALSLLAYQSVLRMETLDEMRIHQAAVEREIEQAEAVTDRDDDDDDDDSLHSPLSS
jgi:hypothetical protein